MSRNERVTIEATAKRWKALTVGGLAVMLGAGLIAETAPMLALGALVAGAAGTVVGAAGGWWNHG